MDLDTGEWLVPWRKSKNRQEIRMRLRLDADQALKDWRNCQELDSATGEWDDLRRTFGCTLLQADVPMAVVRDALGHYSIAVGDALRVLKQKDPSTCTPIVCRCKRANSRLEQYNMKHLFITCGFALTAVTANAFEYELAFDQSCSYRAESRSFPCEKADHPTTLIVEQRGKWFGVNPGSKQQIGLGLVRNDQYSIVLQNPVYFSGTSILHLMKKTGRFYWSETAYSEILQADEATVRVGRFKLDTK